MKERQKCIICGDRLKWGKFAYEQEVCWICFAANVNEIIERCSQHEEDEKILKHLLDIVEERYSLRGACL